MTVGQLIAKLTELPEDMVIQVVNGDWGAPVDIVKLKQGSWQRREGPLPVPGTLDDEYWGMVSEFVQKDFGQIVVITTP